MTDTRPRLRLFPRLIWHGGVVLMLVLLVVGAVGMVRVLLTGVFPGAGYQGLDLYMRTDPLSFALEILVAVAVLATLYRHVRKSLRIWRYKDNLESLAYRKAIGDGNDGSPVGNMIAKILLIPFVLLAVAVVIKFAFFT